MKNKFLMSIAFITSISLAFSPIISKANDEASKEALLSEAKKLVEESAPENLRDLISAIATVSIDGVDEAEALDNLKFTINEVKEINAAHKRYNEEKPKAPTPEDFDRATFKPDPNIARIQEAERIRKENLIRQQQEEARARKLAVQNKRRQELEEKKLSYETKLVDTKTSIVGNTTVTVSVYNEVKKPTVVPEPVSTPVETAEEVATTTVNEPVTTSSEPTLSTTSVPSTSNEATNSEVLAVSSLPVEVVDNTNAPLVSAPELNVEVPTQAINLEKVSSFVSNYDFSKLDTTKLKATIKSVSAILNSDDLSAKDKADLQKLIKKLKSLRSASHRKSFKLVAHINILLSRLSK